MRIDLDRTVRIVIALVTVLSGIYMTATVAAVQAKQNVFASDFSGVLQLSAVAISTVAAGLLALTLQNLDRLWLSIIELVLYGFATLSAMAGSDSEIFLNSPVTFLWVLMAWLSICFIFYLFHMRGQWKAAGEEIVHEHNARQGRAQARERAANPGGEVPEWDDTSLPPPRL